MVHLFRGEGGDKAGNAADDENDDRCSCEKRR
jgi:hypothetical protein